MHEDLHIGAQSGNPQIEQRDLQIAQIPRSRGTHMSMYKLHTP